MLSFDEIKNICFGGRVSRDAKKETPVYTTCKFCCWWFFSFVEFLLLKLKWPFAEYVISTRLRFTCYIGYEGEILHQYCIGHWLASGFHWWWWGHPDLFFTGHLRSTDLGVNMLGAFTLWRTKLLVASKGSLKTHMARVHNWDSMHAYPLKWKQQCDWIVHIGDMLRS